VGGGRLTGSVSGLSAGTTHQFSVRALNALGASTADPSAAPASAVTLPITGTDTALLVAVGLRPRATKADQEMSRSSMQDSRVRAV
jgi:hypothetical protein